MKTVEICCGSYYDALMAYKGGAKRVELNSALYLGGLTPSLSSLILTKKDCPGLKVICMVRSRGAGFCYNDEDYQSILMDARILLENGADGIAFGFLNEDCAVDETKTKEMLELIKSFNKEAVFHRAFDCVKDPYSTIEKLIELGADRILTSGQRNKAFEGKELIKELQIKYGNQIEILAGSGVNSTNAKQLMEYTGINQVHSSCKDWLKDSTTSNEYLSYSYTGKDEYDVVSEELVRKIVASI